MPFILYPLAAVLGVAYYASTEQGGGFVDEVVESTKEVGRDFLVSGVVVTALGVLPLEKKHKIIIGSAYSAYLIAKIKAEEKQGKSVIEKAKVEEVTLDNTWLF